MIKSKLDRDARKRNHPLLKEYFMHSCRRKQKVSDWGLFLITGSTLRMKFTVQASPSVNLWGASWCVAAAHS